MTDQFLVELTYFEMNFTEKILSEKTAQTAICEALEKDNAQSDSLDMYIHILILHFGNKNHLFKF